jgi:hypothetical protein
MLQQGHHPVCAVSLVSDQVDVAPVLGAIVVGKAGGCLGEIW